MSEKNKNNLERISLNEIDIDSTNENPPGYVIINIPNVGGFRIYYRNGRTTQKVLWRSGLFKTKEEAKKRCWDLYNSHQGYRKSLKFLKKISLRFEAEDGCCGICGSSSSRIHDYDCPVPDITDFVNRALKI